MEKEKKENYFKTVNENIEKYGFHNTYIIEEINITPFGYSTGIFENFKIPELFISGLPINLTMELINNYAEKYKFKKVPLNQRIENFTDRFPIYFIEVEKEKLTEYTLSSIKYYENKEYKYLQLVFPDVNGHFPNEKDYKYDQTVMGNFK